MAELLECQNIINGKKCQGTYSLNLNNGLYYCDLCGSEMNPRFFLLLHNMSRVIQNLIPSPQYKKLDGLTEEEQKIFRNSCSLFERILDGLKAKGLLRTKINPTEVQRMAKIYDNSRFISLAFNNALKNFKKPQDIESAISSEKEPYVMSYTLYSHFLGNILYDFEALIKTSLVFILKEYDNKSTKKQSRIHLHKKMALGTLISNIKKLLPVEGQELDDSLDVKLRNSIAHGTFWFDGGKVFLSQNSYLDEVEPPININQFLWKIRQINLISHAFVETLVWKAEKGYFIA